MGETYQILVAFAIRIVATFLVYKNEKKRQMAYGGLWVAAAFILPLVAFVYYVYTKVQDKKVVLTKKQKITAEHERQLAARRREIEAERRDIAKKQSAEGEEAKAEAVATRERLQKALEEERELKQELKAKRLKLK